MWHSRPVSTPPPFMANAILNFHFDFPHTSLSPSLGLKILVNGIEDIWSPIKVSVLISKKSLHQSRIDFWSHNSVILTKPNCMFYPYYERTLSHLSTQ